MYYGTIYDKSTKYCTTDGDGIRVSLYVSGCRRHCKGCHNPETWDFKYGKLYTKEVEEHILEDLKPDYVAGFTFCGGEPFEEENQRELVKLAKKIKEVYPNKTIWTWTGYEYEDLLEGGQKHCEVTDELLSYCDVAVVGPFILEQRDITDNNRYRGSLNQRVIDLNETRRLGHKVFLANIPNNE